MDKISDKDLYKILHINTEATTAEIKSAYRRLARIYHPDINESQQGKQIFKDVRFAYEILSDENKRKLYDLEHGFNQTKNEEKNTDEAEENESINPPKENKSGKNFSQLLADILDGIFVYAKKAGKQKEKSGNDIFANVTISSKEALLGTNRIINIMQSTLCTNCGGKKFINESLCPLCKGTGEISTHKKINAKIPPNTKNGDSIKLDGLGNKSDDSTKSGDLYLIVSVDEKSLFTVSENIVYMDLPISTFEAVLGANIQIPTIYENITIKIPPNTSSGQRFRLKGQGILDKDTGLYGDMIVTVVIKVPKTLSSKELKLYNELKEINTFDVREGLKSGE